MELDSLKISLKNEIFTLAIAKLDEILDAVDRLECCHVDKRRPSSAPQHQIQQLLQHQQQHPDGRFEAARDCSQHRSTGPISSL